MTYTHVPLTKADMAKLRAKLPPLITTGPILGYDNVAITAALGDAFDAWARGITMCGYIKPDGSEGCLVYLCDVEAFLAGLPCLD